jgi:ribosomal protein S18 acetylase RimI-like enzyme
VKLVHWTSDDLIRHIDDVLAVYGEAMNYAADMIEARRVYIGAHARRPGFRAVATLGDDGTVAGFGYGYLSSTGQWWHDQVSNGLGRQARKIWLTDCFELVELHVRPAAQGYGIGAQQLFALLTGAPGRVVLLSTPEADEQRSRAWRLYRRFGFVDVLRHYAFPGDERPFAVLGRRLPLDVAPRELLLPRKMS